MRVLGMQRGPRDRGEEAILLERSEEQSDRENDAIFWECSQNRNAQKGICLSVETQ